MLSCYVLDISEGLKLQLWSSTFFLSSCFLDILSILVLSHVVYLWRKGVAGTKYYSLSISTGLKVHSFISSISLFSWSFLLAYSLLALNFKPWVSEVLPLYVVTHIFHLSVLQSGIFWGLSPQTYKEPAFVCDKLLIIRDESSLEYLINLSSLYLLSRLKSKGSASIFMKETTENHKCVD